ncbi:unnamed protein product, partial [Mesorhabditis spiculigera]
MVVAALMAVGVLALINVNVEAEAPAPESPPRRITQTQPQEDQPASKNPLLPDTDGANRQRQRKRDWAKKVYQSLTQTSRLDDGGGILEPRDEKLIRRNSTATPLQMAKEIKRRTMHYFRPKNGGNHIGSREALPRPPMEFFEPADLPEIPMNLTPEVFYIMHNLKMLELPAEWRLDPKEIHVRQYEAGEYVVSPGDDDDSIFVPLEGALAVYISPTEGKDSKGYLVKKIYRGSAFFSLLSMLDILMDHPSVFKTVSLRAIESTKVARFSIRSFVDAYKENPHSWSRPIQIVCTRLLHVTMTTLHNYMGLSSELMKPRPKDIRAKLLSSASGSALVEPAGSRKGRKNSGRGKTQNAYLDASPDEKPEIAAKWFADALKLVKPTDYKLLGELKIQAFEEGDIIIEQGCEEERLALVLTGTICLNQDPVFPDPEDSEEVEAEEKWATTIGPKELIGGLQVLTNEPSFYTYRAKTGALIAFLEKDTILSLIEKRPIVYLSVAHSVLSRLSSFVRGVDFALDWVLVDSGQAAYKQGDIPDSIFVVLSGRLRSVEKKTVIEEFGRGDVLGMIELLQKKPRATTVLAVRFSQLAKIPEGLLNFIKMSYPQVGFRLVHLLGQYYTQLHRRSINAPSAPTRFVDQTGADPMSHIKNLRTIAVIPAFPEVPLTPFTCELYRALSNNCRVIRLSADKVGRCLHPDVLDKQADFRLMHWLNVQEESYSLVIYECDYTATNWTRRCLRQADAILLVGIGTKAPPRHSLIDEVYALNQQDGLRANKELVLLWPEDTTTPTGTYQWLKGSYFSGHHHIRAPKRMFKWPLQGDGTKKFSEQQIVEYYEENVFCEKVDIRSDFGRLARILTGNSIGLVLGGGGARGAAHIGVIHAMTELGIPVDMVGGTSIGSMIGGLFAETPDSALGPRAKNWFMGMCSFWRKIWDLTYAHTAMFTGAGFNKTLRDLFGDREIEDLWIPYFCISTDISTSEMRVHRSGPLWAYARASMSLAGYLPPICDPQDGHHLLDGGYVNNLPADVMRLVLR